MRKVLVLGCGLVGAEIARKLSLDSQLEVTSADLNSENLKSLSKLASKVSTLKLDASSLAELETASKDSDLIISAVPGFIGYRVLENIIELEKDAVDIAFSPEDLDPLVEMAKGKNCTIVADCGVAPGLSNVLSAFGSTKVDNPISVAIYVGGIPVIRNYPFQHRAVFSPSDLIDEYLRPARYLSNGGVVVKEPLSDLEMLEFEGIGTLEAFLTDGTRSLLHTLNVPTVYEKTLRYPGHAAQMQLLKDIGMFSEKEIEVNGVKIKPHDFTSELLKPLWKLKDGEKDLTAMRVVTEGTIKNKPTRHVQTLVDYFDQKEGVHSMARTTGYTAVSVGRMILEGEITKKGLLYPESLGFDSKQTQSLLTRLKLDGIEITEELVK